jgi:hypothetical protein
MRMKDAPNAIWSSKGEGQGAWIQIRFKQLIQLSRMEFQERTYPGERSSQFEIIYDNGETELINLKNTSEPRDFKLKPIKTSSVKIVIKSVYGTYNNGGAFNFWGVPCINTDNNDDQDPQSGLSNAAGVAKNKIKPLFKPEKAKPIKLHCKDSVSNSRKFESVKKGYDVRTLVYCGENCAPADVPVYGDTLYSKDSSVCKSAFHSQKLPVEGGNVWIVFKNGLNSYKSNFRNGIKSLSKGKSDVSLSFEIYKEEDNIILQAGSKIDLANPVKVGWLPAIITQVTDKDEFLKILTVSIEGGTDFIKYRQFYPSGIAISK